MSGLSRLKDNLKKSPLILVAVRSVKHVENAITRFLNLHLLKYVSPSSKYLGAPKHELWTWVDVEAYVRRKQEKGDKTVLLKKLYEQPVSFPAPALTIGTPAQGAALEQETNMHYCEYVCLFPNARISMRDFNLVTEDDYLIQPFSNYYGSQPRSHVVYNKLRLPVKKQLDGSTLCLKSWGNAYHVLHDAACSVKLLRDAGVDISAIDHFLVFDYSEEWYNKVYAKLGLPKHKFVNGNAKHTYKCEQLFVTTYYEHHGSWYGNFLKETFLPAIPVQHSYGKKLFISRAKSRTRRIINEEEVVSFLAGKGFATVFCEDLTMEQQASIYNQADCIVAAHGANLVNILFCKPGTKICEIRYAQHGGYYKKLYYQMAADCGLQYFLLYAANGNMSRNKSLYDADIYVDVKDLGRMLCAMHADD